MPQDILSYLTGLSVDELCPIVHQILDPNASPIGAVSVAKIGRSAGTATAGIFHVSGRAATVDGDHPWSSVVKVIGDAETRATKKDSVAAERELAVYRSGVFASQQHQVRSLMCYAIQEWNEMQFVWLEDMSGAPQPPWIPEYYLQAARHFGQFNARWPESALPEWVWLNKRGLREKYFSADLQAVIGRLSEFEKHPLARRALTSDVVRGLRQLGQDGDELFRKIQATPKGVCHGDCHPKNLFPLPNVKAGGVTVAIDWAQVGIGNLGGDIGMLLGSPLKWMELYPHNAAALVDPIFEAYVTGLEEVGWSGNADQVRLTYLTCFVGEALRMTTSVSYAIDWPDSRSLFEKLWQIPFEQIFDGWGEAYRFFLSYKPEAIQLARRL